LPKGARVGTVDKFQGQELFGIKLSLELEQKDELMRYLLLIVEPLAKVFFKRLRVCNK